MREEEEILDDEQDSSEDEDLYDHYSYTADPRQQPLRIDKYLMDRIENATRNKVQNAIKAGNVTVNGDTVKPNYKVRAGDKMEIVVYKPSREHKLEPENIPLDILYEDEHLVVINKPSGLVVHPGVGNYTGTLVNALLYYFDNLPYRDDETRPGLVHRLDKETSGAMVIAKNELTLNHLAKQFFNRTIHRRYVSLVWGDVEEDEGHIEGNIGRDPRFRKLMAVYPDGDQGKHAATNYTVLERFGYVTLIECRLETGRTHQIRVHMKYINHTVFNDERYGGDKILKGTIYSKYKQFVENCFKLCPRQALHARSLGFVHPATKEEMHFECPLPEDMDSMIEKWRKYTAALR